MSARYRPYVLVNGHAVSPEGRRNAQEHEQRSIALRKLMAQRAAARNERIRKFAAEFKAQVVASGGRP